MMVTAMMVTSATVATTTMAPPSVDGLAETQYAERDRGGDEQFQRFHRSSFRL
jgi:hypothetical protein